MTIEKGKVLLQEFKQHACIDTDAFFVIHFSRQEDRFEGDFENMDGGDAMIIIKRLIQNFNLNAEVVAAIN
jgi:hypothetical protein